VLPYWLLFAICAAGALEHRRRPTATLQGGPLLALFAAFACLMIGLRYRVGGDWENYVEIFQVISYYDLGDIIFRGDPGYQTLNWLCNHFGLGLWAVNTICALIFMWGLVRFARSQPNPWLVLLVAVPYLIIVVAMGYTRQAVAMGFILAGLPTLRSGSIKTFALYVALGATFHKTGVIVLPLVALAMVQQRFFAGALVILLFAMLYYFLLQGSMDNMMNRYVVAGYKSEGAGIRVAMNLPPAALFLLFQDRFGLEPAEKKLWRIFSYAAFGALLMLWLISSSTLVDRLALYLIPLQLLVLSRIPYAFANRGKANGQIAAAVIAYSATVQFVWLNYATHASYWVPYQLYPF
jgi:hypothetical protein